MKNLNILQVCSSRAWGGMEMQVVELASALQEHGHDVGVLCHPESPILSASEVRALSCKTMNLDSYFHPLHIVRLARYFKEKKFDMVHCHYTKDLWSIIPAVELGGGGNVILTKSIGPGKRKGDPLHKWMYKRVKGVIAVSAYIHRRVLEAYPVDPVKAVTLHYGVDLKLFDPTLYNGQKVRTEFSVHGEELLVGIVGRISPAKGHKEFLQAAYRVREELPGTKFLIVGSASPDEMGYEREVRELAHNIGLGEDAIFTGYRDDIPALLSALDLFVLPSHMEAFGIILIEAMAMGRACVATAAGGVLDIIEPGVSGILVPPRNVDTLAEAIIALLTDRGRRERLGRAARKRVEEQFSMNHIITRLEKMYLHIMRQERRTE